MTREAIHRVKRASLVIGAVTVVSLGVLSFEMDDEQDGPVTYPANASGVAPNAAPLLEAS